MFSANAWGGMLSWDFYICTFVNSLPNSVFLKAIVWGLVSLWMYCLMHVLARDSAVSNTRYHLFVARPALCRCYKYIIRNQHLYRIQIVIYEDSFNCSCSVGITWCTCHAILLAPAIQCFHI